MVIYRLLQYSYRLNMTKVLPPSTPGAFNSINQPSDPIEPSDEEIIDSVKQEIKFKNTKGIVSTIALFLAAPLMALFLIVFVIQSYEVDGPSMQDTLHNKDLLIVNKLDHTFSRITNRDYIPNRYDIIIFNRDESGGYEKSNVKQLVKRTIGLPGERVVVNNGIVTVYNKEHPEGFNPDEGKEYSKTIQTTPGTTDLVVQSGDIFVLGDNRTNSLDSRFFGAISNKDIVGKLTFRVFPLNKARSF